MSDYLTQVQFAAKCGVCVRQFRRWREAGKIPAPDSPLPGLPRWSVKLVAQTLKKKADRQFGSKAQHHARKSANAQSANPLHSMVTR